MKKLISFIAISLLITTSVLGGERIVTYKDLPTNAQAFLSTHFADQKVVNVSLIQNWKSKEYKVLLTNGGSLLFGKTGSWKSISLGKNTVPDMLIPLDIQAHVTKEYPKAKIIEILIRSNGGYDIKLTNGYHVHFNNKMKVLYTDLK